MIDVEILIKANCYSMEVVGRWATTPEDYLSWMPSIVGLTSANPSTQEEPIISPISAMKNVRGYTNHS